MSYSEIVRGYTTCHPDIINIHPLWGFVYYTVTLSPGKQGLFLL